MGVNARSRTPFTVSVKLVPNVSGAVARVTVCASVTWIAEMITLGAIEQLAGLVADESSTASEKRTRTLVRPELAAETSTGGTVSARTVTVAGALLVEP